MMRTIAVAPALVLAAALASNGEVSSQNCSFRAAPDEFLGRQSRAVQETFDRSAKWNLRAASAPNRRYSVSPWDIPRRNFIDVEIFDRIGRQGIPSAPLSTDEEFFRRVHLDLTGHLPSPSAVREFLSDSRSDKRNRVIDRLLYSPEFIHKWTMWLGDLLQNAQVLSNVNRQFRARNAYHDWIRAAIADQKPLKDIAYELIVAAGNTFHHETAASNYLLGALTPMGPVHDTWDNMLYQSAARFLGIGHYDCILCHDGRGRLDQLSLWGKRTNRVEAWQMAAFFSRTRLQPVRGNDDPDLGSYNVADLPTGNYTLNTNFGNRPFRTPIGPVRGLDPEYRINGWKPAPGSHWRAEFAEFLIRDPMFARNFANRIWKEVFNLALAEPVDGLDPDRLDPARPPEQPWTFQATHPELLEKLAARLVETNYNLREYLRLLVESSAYQLSSRYDGEWKLDYVPLFARHYPRRLMAEEIHDAVVKATGSLPRYTINGWLEPVSWAMQLPDPAEPRGNREANNFMNAFVRGNRDTQPRSQAGSILQQLNLMNDLFVLNRIRVANSPTLRELSALASNAQVAEGVFLLFLSRMPSEEERKLALDHLSRARTAAQRNAAIEDLAWACINKLEFIFSY
jgi:hypothetical protein